jgi:hypothetical protein
MRTLLVPPVTVPVMVAPTNGLPTVSRAVTSNSVLSPAKLTTGSVRRTLLRVRLRFVAPMLTCTGRSRVKSAMATICALCVTALPTVPLAIPNDVVTALGWVTRHSRPRPLSQTGAFGTGRPSALRVVTVMTVVADASSDVPAATTGDCALSPTVAGAPVAETTSESVCVPRLPLSSTTVTLTG